MELAVHTVKNQVEVTEVSLPSAAPVPGPSELGGHVRAASRRPRSRRPVRLVHPLRLHIVSEAPRGNRVGHTRAVCRLLRGPRGAEIARKFARNPADGTPLEGSKEAENPAITGLSCYAPDRIRTCDLRFRRA